MNRQAVLIIIVSGLTFLGASLAALLNDYSGGAWWLSISLWFCAGASALLLVLLLRPHSFFSNKNPNIQNSPSDHILPEESGWRLASALHELKAPLQRMRIHLAQAGLSCHPDNDALNRLDSEIGRLEDTLRRVNELVYLETQPLSEFETVDAGDLLLACQQEHHQEAQASGQTIERLPIPKPFTITANADLLKRCLDQLLLNALAYAGPEACIQISASLQNGRSVSVRVCDNGPGLAPDDDPSELLNPFVRGREGRTSEKPGSGLGLAFVDRAVRAMGGEFHLESMPEGGVCGTIILSGYISYD
jgi:signal transduction histidine kinase